MKKLKKGEFQSEICEACGQSKNYLMAIDRGSVDILKAISVAIRKKGINVIHPRKEMEAMGMDRQSMLTHGHLTSTMIGNLSRLRYHGLIAKTGPRRGNYCLTRKAAEFFKGESFPKYAIIDKATKHQVGYWKPEEYQITIRDFKSDDEYWEGVNFDIVDGRIVIDITKNPINQRQLFQT